MNSFIALDMAWRIDGNHSGIAVMSGDAWGLRLDALSKDVQSRATALNFIAAHASPNAVVAIDAPLVVKNATGQRGLREINHKPLRSISRGMPTFERRQ